MAPKPPSRESTRPLFRLRRAHLPPQSFKILSDCLINALNIPRGTSLSNYTQVYLAFAISGVLHAFGDFVVAGPSYTGISLRFFLSQALAITFEDAVLALARRAGFSDWPTRMARIVGYVWVFVWFSVSLPLFQDWQLALYPEFEAVLPFSVVRTYVPPAVYVRNMCRMILSKADKVVQAPKDTMAGRFEALIRDLRGSAGFCGTADGAGLISM